jgi:DHA1 family bicyclomycin/chloramphenicol resistance-like MFS transporter
MEQTTSLEKNPPIVTLLLGALTGLTSLSIDMSLPAMPQLQQAFSASVSSVQLTLSLFLAGFALGQIICGPLSDRYGRRPILLSGLTLFSLAGLVCAISSSLLMLISFRFLQGLGASVGPVVARAVVRDRYDFHRGAAVLSQMTQVMIVAPLIAPTLGSYLLVGFGWPAIFLTLGASGALLGFLCWCYLPETANQKWQAPDDQKSDARGRLHRFFEHPASLRYALTTCFAYAGMFAYIGASSFTLIDVFGVAEKNFGYFFGLTAAPLLVSASINRLLLKRGVATLRVLRFGVLINFTAGLAVVIVAWLKVGGLAGILVPMMAYMFGQGLLMPNATAAAMAPHGRSAGAISSVLGSLQTGGGALSAYIVGAFYDHTARSLATTVSIFALLVLITSDFFWSPGNPADS